MAITQKGLAKHFKVSQVTISRALRGDRGVNEKLRRSIVAEAVRNGYSIDVTNYEARRMRQQACGRTVMTKVVCAMLSLKEDPGERSFIGRIANGLWEEAEKRGIDVVLAGPYKEELPLIVSRRQVDGVVRLLSDVNILTGKFDTPVPWVSILYDIPGVDLVTVDNIAGACEVGRHVFGCGHRVVAYAGPESGISRDRLAGLQRAASETGVRVAPEHTYIRRYMASEEMTLTFVDEVFGSARGSRNKVSFTSLVTYNDYMAAIVVRRLSELGWRIPEDLSVAGFDGVVPPSMGDPGITSAAIPLEQLGAESIRLIYVRLERPEAPRRRMVLDTKLVPGKTVAMWSHS